MKPFLQEVAEDLVAKFGEDLQHCAIIFNNKRPAAYLQKHLAEIYQKAFWSPSFFTIQEFFAKSTELKIADFYSQFFTLHQLYNKLLAKERSSDVDTEFVDMAKFFPIAKIILSDFAQIDNDLVDANKLFHELEDIALINQQFDYLTEEQHHFLSQFWTSYSEGKHKNQQENFIKMWRRMPVLYQQFHEELKKQKLTTMAMAYRELATANANNLNFFEEFKDGKIILIGFNALTKAESRTFKRWQDEGKALFYFDTDSYYLDDPLQEAGLFLRKNLDSLGLINALDSKKAYIKQKARIVNVYKVQGQNAQAKILNNILGDDYKVAGADKQYGQTAVVLADESLLLPTLQTIPSEDENLEVNLNVTMGVSFLSSTLFGLADLWLGIQKNLNSFKEEEVKTVSFKTVEAFLTHPLTGMSETMRSKILKKFVEEQLADVPQQRLLPQKGLFVDFFENISQPLEIVLGLKNALEAVLKKQLAAGNLKKIDAELFVKTLLELNRLHDTLAAYARNEQSKNLELNFVISLVQKALQSISVPLSGNPLTGIQVMGLLETRNLNFENVVILGLNDGTIPKTNIGNSFIPDSLRRVYGLPVLENQDAISAYMFYRLIQRAEKISVVYNSLTDESNSGEPSRFLKQLEYESGFSFNYFEQELNVEVEKNEPITIEKTEAVMKVLNSFLTGYRTLSASALTTYISNPIDFFFKYVAGVKEPEEVKEVVEANDIGSILHGVMEDFYTELKASNAYITKERIAEKRKAIDELIARNFSKIVYKDANRRVVYNGMQSIVVAIIEEYANIILDFDEESSPFTIIQMEEEMIIPFEFKGSKGETLSINVKGIIDRVDVNQENVTRIVDYKTGADRLKYSSIEESFNTHSKSLNKALVQTLFYTHIFETAKNIKNVEPNLYIVRTMRDKAVCFNSFRRITDETGKEKSQKLSLNKEFLASEKELFLKFLQDKLAELFNNDIPFYISENPVNYQYSKYTTLMVK